MAIYGRTQVDRGDGVEALQDGLVTLGHLTDDARRGGVGRFGPRTEAAVRAFQRAAGLSPSGVADLATQAALASVLGGSAIRRGAAGAVVRGMQDRLVELGLMDRDRIGTGAGKFGPYTEEALHRFQVDRGIRRTGVLGPVTYKALFAARPAGGGSGGGAPGGSGRFVLPIRNMRTTRVNRTLHGKSRHRSRSVPGHNVFHGFGSPGAGDALDIYAPTGTPVFAIANGRISRHRGRGGGKEHVYLEGDGWVATYAHIRARHGEGSRVKQGEVVGTLRPLDSGPHLHFELWLGGNAVHASTSAGLRRRMLDRLDAD